jgi:hypothetical protein
LNQTEFKLSPIQCSEYQAEYDADQNRSAEWKVEPEIIALIVEVEWQTPQPKRKSRPQHHQKTDKGENDTHDHEQPAELLHTCILSAGYAEISS